MKKGTGPLEVLAMLLVGAAAVVAWTGGWRTEILGLPVSARNPGRLATYGLALIAIRVALARDHLAPARELSDVLGRILAGALLAAALMAWAAHLSPYVGGADSYGYVSAAERLRRGSLIQSEPLAALLPYPNAIEVATPLGYVPTTRADHASVPAYPLGLPALMALASTVAGPRAPFFVTPLMGLALVGVCCWFVYRRVGDVTPALAAGAAVAIHPVMFTYAIQPMSDVPAAACFVGAMALLLRGGDAIVAGLLASAAFLTRPALLPGAAALAVIPLMSEQRRVARVLALAATIAVGVAVQIWSQWYLYGHPLANGYGPATELFSLDFLPANARSYAHWMLAVHGPMWILGLLVAVTRTGTLRDRALVAVPLLVAAAPYAVYRTYDHWETLRFVLPLLVGATVAAVTGLFVLFRGILSRAGTWLALAVVMTMMGHWVSWLERELVFERSISEQRFARAGELVSRATPEDAVVLASLHSGSVRYYSGRSTLDWAKIPPGQFDATIAALVGNSRTVFVMIDGQEEQMQFEARHGAVLGTEGWLPSGQVRDIRLYQSPRRPH